MGRVDSGVGSRTSYSYEAVSYEPREPVFSGRAAISFWQLSQCRKRARPRNCEPARTDLWIRIGFTKASLMRLTMSDAGE